MKRIRIVYMIDQLNIGGSEKQLLAIIERLDRSRFEPYLVCLRASEYMERTSIDCHKKVLGVRSLASWSGIKQLLLFSRYLKQEKIDIVQTFFFDSTVFGVLAARLGGVKRILSSRRDMGFWYTPITLLTLFFINILTHRIVVNSEAIKENVYLREHVRRGKIDVIKNGIDLEPFTVQHDITNLRHELGIPVKDQIVGIVANLNRRVKRVDLFIDAAAEVLKNKENVSFVIVGEGQYSEQLKNQAEEVGISRKVHFTGSQENVIPYLQLFDVGVLTSESEGFANSVIEYMAAGLPVVCFASGGNTELIVDDLNGVLCYEYNFFAIQKSVLYLLKNKSLLNDISRNNVDFIKKFDWIYVIDKYQKYIDCNIKK